MKVENQTSKLIKYVLGVWTVIIVSNIVYYQLDFIEIKHDILIALSVGIGILIAIFAVSLVNKLQDRLKNKPIPTVNQFGQDSNS